MTRPVFISYSERDRPCALELLECVEAAGHPCWIAPRDVSPAAEWAAEIVEAIAAARIMVLVFSSASNESPQVRREVERAVYRNVPILPFRIENVLPSKSLEYFLGAQQWLDGFPPPREPHYRKVCAHLGRTLGIEAPTAGRPPQRAAVLDPSELAHIERALADRLGPIARILVARAAARSDDLDALAAALAAEIPEDQERRRFVELCRGTRGGGRL